MKKFYKPRNIVPEIEEISFEEGKINAQPLMSILGFLVNWSTVNVLYRELQKIFYYFKRKGIFYYFKRKGNAFKRSLNILYIKNYSKKYFDLIL